MIMMSDFDICDYCGAPSTKTKDGHYCGICEECIEQQIAYDKQAEQEAGMYSGD